ncbi:MAG: hypothetical protein WKF65_08335 [Gaiellaceae bacterium]
MPLAGRYHRSSLRCDAYELRITQRCLCDELGAAGGSPLEGLDRYEIVRAFVGDRAATPVGTRRVGRGRTDRPLWRLGFGHDHRGATWHEEDLGVVWLCAYARHRSGEDDDAFPYFNRLIDADLIYPTEDDYTLLEEERAARFIDLARADAAALLAEARLQPGVEIRGVIGREHEVGVIVVTVELVGDELFVAFPARAFPVQGVPLLVAFAPERVD